MESLNQALVECVKAAGGSANVGPKLWPEKTREAAQRLLLDCLNEDRPSKLSPEQVLLILKLARDRGFHGGISYVLDSLGYAPTNPIEPKDEAAEVFRQIAESQRQIADNQKSIQLQIERLASLQPQLRAVA
jgi:hypothetical protein